MVVTRTANVKSKSHDNKKLAAAASPKNTQRKQSAPTPYSIVAARGKSNTGAGLNASIASNIETSDSVFNYLTNDCDVANCKVCDKEVSNIGEVMGLTCDRCTSWLHFECSGLSRYEYDFFNNNPISEELTQVKWACKICKDEQKIENNPFDLVAKLATKVEKLTLQNVELQKGLAAVLDILNGRKAEEKIVEKKVETAVLTTVREAFTDNKEREKKKANIIMFNVEECQKEPHMTEPDVVEEDFMTVNNIIKQTQGDYFTPITDSTQVVRLGERKTNQTRPRPIKVTLDSEEEKWSILGRSGNLKKRDIWKDVKIQQDKTSLEITADNKLKEECTRKRKETKLDYVIFAQNVMLRTDIDAFKAERTRKREAERKKPEVTNEEGN